MHQLQRLIVDDVVRQTGAHDQPHVFGGPPGDPGLTGPGSMSWEINGDLASVLVGGMSAIVMEILHPSVMAGVQDLSSYREQPERRGRTTFGYVVVTTFGSTVAATRLIKAVKGMHAKVAGTRPDGVAYRALDPRLITWVHTCIPWAVMTAYERFHRPLSTEEKDRYLAEQAVIGRMGGGEDVPETVAALEDYMEAMRHELGVNQQTLEFFDFLLSMPFGLPDLGPLNGPARRLQLEAGLSLMPAWARRLCGVETSALTHRLVHDPMLGSYARAVRWAFGTPPFKRLALERVAAAPADAALRAA